MPYVIISCITACFVDAGNETSGMIIPRVNTHQQCYASSNQLHFSDSVVVLSFPSLLPPPLIKDTHGYPKAAKPFYQNYSPLVTRPQKTETHNTVCHHPILVDCLLIATIKLCKGIIFHILDSPGQSMDNPKGKCALAESATLWANQEVQSPFIVPFYFLKGCPNSSKLSWSEVIDVKKPRSFAMACWMRKEENCLYSAVLCFSRRALSQRSRKRRKMNKWKGIMFIF